MAHTEECRGCSCENRCDFIRCTKEIEKEIRAKAIDETCLKIFNHLLSEIEWNRVLVDDWDALAEEFKEIAEQLKGSV